MLDHLEIAAPDVAVWLTNGSAFMTEHVRFAEFIGKTQEEDEVSKLEHLSEHSAHLSISTPKRRAIATNCGRWQKGTRSEEGMTRLVLSLSRARDMGASPLDVLPICKRAKGEPSSILGQLDWLTPNRRWPFE